MPLRDLALFLTLLALLPFCFLRPWVGALVWAWLGYMNPHRLTWGPAFEMQFAQMVGLATLGGFIFTGDRKPFLWTRETVLLLALWGWFGVTTIFAEHPAEAWDKLFNVSKILLMALITISLFQDRRRLRWLLLVIAFSIGFYGLKGGLFSLLTGGEHTVWGPEGSFIGSNNELGMALNMVIPMLVFLARDEPRRWLRLGLRLVACVTVIAVPFTYSRGAVLGLVLVLAALLLGAKQRLLIALVLGMGLLASISFVPERWLARMETLANYADDGSAQGRLAAWRVAYQIAADHPLTGGGFGVFYTQDVYLRYGEVSHAFAQDAHSLYFNLLGEHGWIGLGLFLALMLSVLVKLRRLRKEAVHDPGRAWAANWAHMLQISFLAYLATGAFLSVAYYDLTYQLIVIVIILEHIAVPTGASPDRPTPARLTPRVRPALPVRSR